MDSQETTTGIRPLSQVLLYCTESSCYFADLLFDHLRSRGIDIEKGHIIRKTFDGGESYLRLAIDGRYDLFGKDLIFVAGLTSDQELFELLRVGTAMAEYGSRQRIFVIPFLNYSTMERAVLPGEIVTCKTHIRMMSTIPSAELGNTFLFMDLHVNGILHYFEGPTVRIELYGQTALMSGIQRHLDEIGANPTNFMFASADLGRPKWVQSFAKRYGTDIAFVRKTRTGEKTEVHEVIGRVTGKHVVIYDDMTRSAGTLLQAAGAYLDNGALSVAAAVSHFAANSEAVVERISQSRLARLIVTNSHPFSQHESVRTNPKFIVVNVVPIFGDVVASGLRTGGCGSGFSSTMHEPAGVSCDEGESFM